MYSITIGRTTCKISLLFPAVLSLLLYFNPSGIVLMCVTASIVHELGHIVTLIMLGEIPRSITFSFYGLRMTMYSNTKVFGWRAIAVAFAGPAANLLSAFLLNIIFDNNPFIWVHIGLASLNLMPVIPLDGGYVLRSVFGILFDESLSDIVIHIVEIVACFIMCVLSVAVALYSGYNISLMIVTIYILLCKLFYNLN